MPLENPAAKVDQDAMDKLVSLEAEQAKEFAASDAQSIQTEKADARPLAAQDGKSGESDSTNKSGIPSEAEKQEIETAKSEADKEGKELDVDDKGTPKRDTQGKFVKRDKVVKEPMKFSEDEEKKFLAWSKQTQSKYAHDETKKILRWDKIKEREAELTKQADTQQKNFQGALAKFNADVQTFRNEQQAARPSPEKFESFAQKLITDAALKEAEMVKAEANGDMDKAKELYAEVKGLKDKAQEAKAHAEHLRKNPPPDQKQVQARFQADQKTWIDKAKIDFPEFGKKESPLYGAALEYFKQMSAQEPAVARLPGFVYFCVERAALKSAADRVPSLVKELDEIKAKVKEQDALLNPTPSGGVNRSQAPKSFDQMTSDEQFASLRQEAASLRR